MPISVLACDVPYFASFAVMFFLLGRSSAIEGAMGQESCPEASRGPITFIQLTAMGAEKSAGGVTGKMIDVQSMIVAWAGLIAILLPFIST